MSLPPLATTAHYVSNAFGAVTSDLEAMLQRASRKVRGEFTLVGKNVDLMIEDELLDADLVADVVCGMVKRAKISAGGEGVTSISETTGPFQTTQQFANPMGDLYLTKADFKDLGLSVVKKRAWSVDMLAGGRGG